MAITPELAVPPVPTFKVNEQLPLTFGIDGVVPKPELIEGELDEHKTFGSSKVVVFTTPAVVVPMAPGAAKVAPPRDEAFRLATLVVDATINGAVPVATVD